MERIEALTTDGWRLSACKLGHRGPRRGTVLALHAMMVDGRTLRARRSWEGKRTAGLAGTLAAHGFDVVVADLRGHGASRPRPPEGTWTYDDLVYRDIPALVDLARGQGPLFLLGHSLGGHAGAAAAACGAATVDGMVLLAANVWMPSLEPSRRRALRKGLDLAAFLAVSRFAGRFPSRWAKMGPADEALPYVEDLARFWREDAWRDRSGRDWLTALARFEGPVLQVTGRGDTRMGHIGGVAAWTARFPRAELWHVGRGDHGLSMDPDHMGVVTDPRSEPLWHAIGGWLAAQADGGEGPGRCAAPRLPPVRSRARCFTSGPVRLARDLQSRVPGGHMGDATRWVVGAAFLICTGCVGEDWVSYELVDEGRVCVSAEADGDIQITVTPDLCLSSSCSDPQEARCEVQVEGDTLTVTSRFRWDQNESPRRACTLDCGQLTATCTAGPVPPGTYTIEHGIAVGEVELPSTEACEAL